MTDYILNNGLRKEATKLKKYVLVNDLCRNLTSLEQSNLFKLIISARHDAIDCERRFIQEKKKKNLALHEKKDECERTYNQMRKMQNRV